MYHVALNPSDAAGSVKEGFYMVIESIISVISIIYHYQWTLSIIAKIYPSATLLDFSVCYSVNSGKAQHSLWPFHCHFVVLATFCIKH
jgi:hypothetical protein